MTNHEQNVGKGQRKEPSLSRGTTGCYDITSVMSGAKDGLLANLGRVPTQSSAGAMEEKGKVHRFPEDLIERAINVPLNFHFLWFQNSF